ncbi:uncharacterized protein TNCV_3156011 [Trichonephila clavipes]|nr:uncharacterized protein TNCV_3156011 [Trichonephila clavipes]
MRRRVNLTSVPRTGHAPMSVCMKAYNLDPVCYYTAPGLSWDSMLKFTKVKIELLMDYDMYLFIEKGIWSGISQYFNRYAGANNKFLPNFEFSKPQNFLLYLDANNLYGWAMSQYLPLNDFKWVDFLDVDNIDENGGKEIYSRSGFRISGIFT